MLKLGKQAPTEYEKLKTSYDELNEELNSIRASYDLSNECNVCPAVITLIETIAIGVITTRKKSGRSKTEEELSR